MKHANDPIYLEFLNIIQCRQPSQIEINDVLLQCVISKDELLSNINDKTTILGTHHIDVENYYNLIFQKLFTSNEIFDVVLDMNLNLNICNNGLKIPILNI
jgi:hypothetical protein